MRFSDAQVAQYRDQGYIVDREMFSSREVQAMRAELARLRHANLLRNVATEGDGKTPSTTKQNLQICPIAPHSDFFNALAWHPKVLARIPQLIGDPVLRHLDQSFLKPARSGAPTNWHQDNAYFNVSDPLRGVGMWVALDDASVANGTMRVIPGSHKGKIEHSRDPDSDHHIRCYPDEEKAVAIEMAAGGALFFCYGCAHATGRNETDKDRAGLALHFINADYLNEQLDRDVAASRADHTYPILTGPEASGGEREYGRRFDGAWEHEVARVLGSVAVTA